jgi:DNA (cytosine-5)-methyltransferase 1
MEPALYCDIDPSPRRALAERIAAGTLPDAPIHDDVRTLVPSSHIDVLTGGFPCVGFSPMGKRAGFEQPGSALFYEVLRVLDESGASAVFMENVPSVRRGIAAIVEELSVKRGFELRWEVVSAAEVGAPHLRRRWFCLGTRPGSVLTTTPRTVHVGGYVPGDWSGVPPPRTVPRASLAPGDQKRFDQRWALVGNSLVPDAARLALCRLITGGAIASLDKDAPVLWAPHDTLQRTTRPTGGYMAAVAAGESTIHYIKPALPIASKRRDWGLVLLPDAVPPPARTSPLQKTALVTAPVEMTLWSTPRHGMVRACRVLTERSRRDLTTQMVFEQGTEGREGVLNPAFGEWMMTGGMLPPGPPC